MLADQVDYVVGVDTHRDEHVLAVVVASTGAVVAQRSVPATSRGYARALAFADEHAAGRRVWAAPALVLWLWVAPVMVHEIVFRGHRDRWDARIRRCQAQSVRLHLT